ncbi:MAG: hypothetical protein KGJ13_02110 [Patescibacteria group bacterium]|nr:hypothetical protein [Patescibacteria group bacterium]
MQLPESPQNWSYEHLIITLPAWIRAIIYEFVRSRVQEAERRGYRKGYDDGVSKTPDRNIIAE